MSVAFKVDSSVEFDDKQSAENMAELMDIDYYRIDRCDSEKYKIIPCTEWKDCQFIPIAIGDTVYHYFYGKVRIVKIERSKICNEVEIVVSKKGKEITIKNERYNDYADDAVMIKGISLERMRITDFFDYIVGLDSDAIRASKEKCTTYLLWGLALVLTVGIVLFLMLCMTEILDIITGGVVGRVIISMCIIVSPLFFISFFIFFFKKVLTK